MDEINPLLAALFGGAHPAISDPYKDQAPITPPSSGLPNRPAELAAPQEQNIDVVGDSWKPHHRTTLGAIADILLSGLTGAKITPFADSKNEQNEQEAMKGFASAPLTAIRRLSQLPHHQKDAWNMYNQYEDNKRADTVASDMEDARKERYQGRMASWLTAIHGSKDPTTSYQKFLPQLNSYAQQHGLDPLPDKYDEDYASTYGIGGGMTVDQQYDNASNTSYRNARLKQMDANTQSNIENRRSEIQDRNARLSETNRHNEVMEARPTGRGKNGVTYVNTKYGPGEVSPDGNKMMIPRADGQVIYFKTGPNQWKMVKKVPAPVAE